MFFFVIENFTYKIDTWSCVLEVKTKAITRHSCVQNEEPMWVVLSWVTLHNNTTQHMIQIFIAS